MNLIEIFIHFNLVSTLTAIISFRNINIKITTFVINPQP